MRTIFRYSNIPFLSLGVRAKRPRWRQVWDPFAIPVLGSEANGGLRSKPRTAALARLHSGPVFVDAFVVLVCFSITRGCDSLRYRRRLIQT